MALRYIFDYRTAIHQSEELDKAFEELLGWKPVPRDDAMLNVRTRIYNDSEDNRTRHTNLKYTVHDLFELLRCKMKKSQLPAECLLGAARSFTEELIKMIPTPERNMWYREIREIVIIADAGLQLTELRRTALQTLSTGEISLMQLERLLYFYVVLSHIDTCGCNVPYHSI